MKIELHALQNFAPANLNRDDTGRPKTCFFGGYRRARISSQSFKRAMRTEFQKGLLSDAAIGIRTRRLVVEIAERIAGQQPPPKEVVDAVATVFKVGGIERPSSGDEERENTKILLFMSPASIDRMTDYFKDRWSQLAEKDTRATEQAVEYLAQMLVDSATIPHIALFGRMIEVEGKSAFGKRNLAIEGACQVAHPMTTNKTEIELDYFTAVDDLQPGREMGASMIGTMEFNSGCFYRYASVDVDQLARNLAGAGREVTVEVVDLTRQTVEAFARAFVIAIPSGKQNSTAAHNMPSFVLAVARDGGNWSLANAFIQPVAPTQHPDPEKSVDLIAGSITALDSYWGELTAMYGTHGITGQWYAAIGTPTTIALKDSRVDSLDALISHVLAATQVAAV